MSKVCKERRDEALSTSHQLPTLGWSYLVSDLCKDSAALEAAEAERDEAIEEWRESEEGYHAIARDAARWKAERDEARGKLRELVGGLLPLLCWPFTMASLDDRLRALLDATKED